LTCKGAKLKKIKNKKIQFYGQQIVIITKTVHDLN